MDPVFTSSSRYQLLVLVLKMMKRTMLVAVFLMLSTKLIAASSSSSCHPGDRDALLAMKAALGNPKQLASWKPDSSSCCDHWRHIECDDSTGRVISLSIFQDDGSLAGTIPDAIAGLDHLENLALRHLPALSGAIPPAIAKLSKLVFLTISRTAVSGPVPSFLGDLKALTELDLSFNSLSGSIPASLADIPNLMSIDIRHNRLTGSLPPLLFSKQAPPPPQDEQEDDDEEEAYYDLINLRLSHNGLSGSIPSEWSTVKFGMVSLSRNAFAGDASALFGRDKPLQLLDLSRNGFSFNLSAVELPEQLSIMDVSHNAINGRVPEQAANLQSFNVSYNLLCGEVPSGMASLFDAYCFQHNSCLCGAPLGACRQPYR